MSSQTGPVRRRVRLMQRFVGEGKASIHFPIPRNAAYLRLLLTACTWLSQCIMYNMPLYAHMWKTYLFHSCSTLGYAIMPLNSKSYTIGHLLLQILSRRSKNANNYPIVSFLCLHSGKAIGHIFAVQPQHLSDSFFFYRKFPSLFPICMNVKCPLNPKR